MTRQHDRGDGTFGECKAKDVANCPYTKRGLSHFDSVEEANEFLEKQVRNASVKKKRGGRKYVRPVFDSEGRFTPESLNKRIERWLNSGESNYLDYDFSDSDYAEEYGKTYRSTANESFAMKTEEEQMEHCKNIVAKALEVGLIQLPEGGRVTVKSEPEPRRNDGRIRYTLALEGIPSDKIYSDRPSVRGTSPYDKKVYYHEDSPFSKPFYHVPMKREYVEALQTAKELIESQYCIHTRTGREFENPCRTARDSNSLRLTSETSDPEKISVARVYVKRESEQEDFVRND